MLQFKKEVSVERKDDQAYVEDDHDEEEMHDLNLDKEKERQWIMVFEDNDGGVYDAKGLLHAKMWEFYLNDKKNLVKRGYVVQVGGHDKNEVLWEVVDNHVVKEASYH